MNNSPKRRIAVAIIENAGKFLITQRKREAAFANLWELPGGKCLYDEDPCLCVIREVKEETGLTVYPQAEAGIVEHVYPDFTAEIHAFFCRIQDGDPQSLESQALVWITWDEIANYMFPAANDKIFSQARRFRAHKMRPFSE